jgi:HEAT repeats/PBS lyase HEAT-like repeat
VVEALLVLVLAFLALAVLLLVVLAIRRYVLARDERRVREKEQRLRPFAIAIVEGEDAEAESLSAADQVAVAEILGRYSRKLRGDADARIGAYFRDSAALRTALRELGARRMWRRATAAYRLGDMACQEVAPALFAALDDPRREVRAAATRSLGRLGVVAAALPVVQAMVQQRVPNGVAGQALLELGPDARVELGRIATHEDPSVRSTAITLLGLVGDSGEAPLAVTALSDPSADVRRASAEALRRIGTFDDEQALRTALEDRMHFVRAEAAATLGVIEAPHAVPRLVEIARTDRFRPARAAARAVARIDPKVLTAAAAEPDAGPHLHEAADLLAV